MTAPLMALDFENGGAEIAVDDEGMKLDDSGLPVVDDGLMHASQDPERANAISAAVTADDDTPEEFVISGPPDGSCHLAAGYVSSDGTRYTDLEVRELRGRDEETLARALATGDLTRYLDAICNVGVVNIGPISDPKELAVALDSLLIGDRDLIVMQVRRMAYGDTTRLSVKCPFCDVEFDVDYSFSEDVPVKPFSVEGCSDLSQRVYDITCPSGKVVEIRLVDGKAQKAVYSSDNLKKTDAELNTLLLKELLVSIDGVAVRGVGPVLDLPAKDRKHLLKWLIDGQPGPKYEDVKQECTDCLREFPLVMDLRSMFLGD